MEETFAIGDWDETLFDWVQDMPVATPHTATTSPAAGGVIRTKQEVRSSYRSTGVLPRWLSANEVAELLHLERHTVYRLLRDGELPGTKIGGQWFVIVDKLTQRLRGEK